MKLRYSITLISLIFIVNFSSGQLVDPTVCADSITDYQVNPSIPNSSTFQWFIDPPEAGEIIEGENTNHIFVKWNYAVRSNVSIMVREVSNLGNTICVGSSEYVYIDIIAPYVDLGYDFPEICDGDSLVLSPGTHFDTPYSYTWHNGSTEPEYIAKNTENIWVQVVDGNGCGRYDTISLLVNPLPELDLHEDSAVVLCDQTDPLVLDPGNFMYYNWHSTQEGDLGTNSYAEIYPSLSVLDTITLTATDYNTCQSSDTLFVIPCNIEALFTDITNTISPNGDGDNDVWNWNNEINTRKGIVFLLDDAVLEIFDRWGRLVFHTENVLEEPWDGTSNGKKLPMDSYYYVLNLNIFNTPPIAGTVNLIR